MSMYRVEWPCCGSVSETEAYEPATCPFCTDDPLKIAVDIITDHLDELIGECMAGTVSPKTIARMRGYLPARCKHSFTPKK